MSTPIQAKLMEELENPGKGEKKKKKKEGKALFHLEDVTSSKWKRSFGVGLTGGKSERIEEKRSY